MRRDARRDENEGPIVDVLRAVGALVFPISQKDMLDLLVGFRGRWITVEVKSDDGTLSEGQRTFIALAETSGLPVAVVRSPEDALRAIGIEFEERTA